MMIKDGSTTPKVAMKEPRSPPWDAPIKVAIFTAIGPGVDSDTATIFKSCFSLIIKNYTIPIAISTPSATMTTNAEIMNPCIIGRIPAFFIFEKEVFKPIAASAQTIRNLLRAFVPDITVAGIGKILAMQDMITKPIINQGNIFLMLKFALMELSFWHVA